MLTGIIEAIGTIASVQLNFGNKTFWLESSLSSQFKVDQSVSHNGVCLTVEEVNGNSHRVTAITETLVKSNLNDWEVGKKVNLERCLRIDSRLDGHLVQGHVDTTAECLAVKEMKGSWQYTFQVPLEHSSLIVEKGSISLNGISLTIFNLGENTFDVAIVPYTYNHTNMRAVMIGSHVNIEFDLIGKYVQRLSQHKMR
jgi:riboflavin synthase